MIHLLNHQNDEIVALLNAQLLDATHLRNINLEETLQFEWPAKDAKAEYIVGRNRAIIPDEESGYREFIIDELDGDANTVIAYCSASFLDLKKQKIVNPATLTGQTSKTAANWVLSGTEWKVGVTDTVILREISFDYMNAYDAIQKVASTFGCELSFRVEIDGNSITGRYVDIVTRLGGFRGKEVRFNKDLEGVRRKVNHDEIVTALVCLGPEKDDGTRLKVIVENETARERWGRNGQHLWDIYEPESSDTDMTIDRLTSLGQTELNKRINSIVEYEVTQAALDTVLGYEHEKAFFSDTIRIKDLHFVPPLYLEARIVEVERPLIDRSQKVYKLGDFVEYSQDEILEKDQIIWTR